MNKERILDEIRRTAADNDGEPLGMVRFQKATGITRDAWLGRFWGRWSEAVAEAGLTPNERTPLVDRDALVEHLAVLTRQIGRFPTDADIGLARSRGALLPHKHLFRKLGSHSARLALARAFARKHPAYQDILAHLPATEEEQLVGAPAAPARDGSVYMLKLGRHYKIGHTTSVPRRHQEIAIELPEKPDVIHVITTDDPSGIEAYWHKRFAPKHTNGEWFALTREDVQTFKRRESCDAALSRGASHSRCLRKLRLPTLRVLLGHRSDSQGQGASSRKSPDARARSRLDAGTDAHLLDGGSLEFERRPRVRGRRHAILRLTVRGVRGLFPPFLRNLDRN